MKARPAATRLDGAGPLSTVGLLRLTVALGLFASAASAQDDSVEVASTVIHPVPIRVAGVAVPIHPEVAAAPGGRQLATIQVRPRPVLWIVPTDGGEAFSFREMWAAYHARWSPAGQRIGFIAAIGPPRIWTVEVDPQSGRAVDPPRMLIRTGANAFAFAPDGERIALVSSRSTAAGASEVHIVDWASRRYRVLLRERGLIYRLDWAPDGDHIYYGLLAETGAAAEMSAITESEEAEGETAAEGQAATKGVARATLRIVRASLRDGSRATVMVAAELLGLSPDGSRLLLRPSQADDPHLVEIAPLDSDPHPRPPLRLALPADAGEPCWAADSRSLLVVRAHVDGGEVWRIPLQDL